jgi:stage V sporulation protein R
MLVRGMRWIGGLPRYLREIQAEIEGYARECGLDFFTTYFEILGYDEMNEIASYGGFPTRYPHWRYGMEYERLKKSSTYGLSKIYEMVINNDPCTAYLLEGNSTVDQKLVMAHVFAHCDFFKNNQWFAHTNRHMIDEMANHGARMRGYINRYGVERVEDFVDVCLSIDNLIDIHNPPSAHGGPGNSHRADDDGDVLGPGEVAKIRAKPYMDGYINPPEFLEEQQRRRAEQTAQGAKFPPAPVGDVMGFLMTHAPLKSWERGVMEIVREEAYYFAPQGQTKIMNEGWATYWHSRIMTERALSAAEIVDYADHASMVTATSGMQLNPYKMGVELFRHIVERWDKGRFGKQWEECDDLDERAVWDTGTGQGIDKIFQVRATHNDVTFIDEFLTFDFVREQMMFSYGFNRQHRRYEIESRQFAEVKQKLLAQLTNMGQPTIRVVDANRGNRGELVLQHEHQGFDLDPGYSEAVLSNIYRVWKRPVVLLTWAEDKPIVAIFDGEQYREDDTEEEGEDE